MNNVKQKTCITVVKNPLTDVANFQEYINITHKVDIIRCTGACFISKTGVPALIDDVYYVKSNLIRNIHDDILVVAPNLGKNIPIAAKDFTNHSGNISGTYTFNIYSLTNGLPAAPATSSVYINLEFIELLQNDQTKDLRITVS